MQTLKLKNRYTVEEIRANIEANEGVASFEISNDREYCNTEALNNALDEYFDHAYMIQDVGYEAVRVEKGEVVFKVVCSDCEDWLEEVA